MHRFTNEQIAMLAAMERKMDSGEQPFCRMNGQRLAVMPEAMEELGLETGQTITGPIFTRILECHLAITQAQLAVQNAAKTPPQE